MILVDSNIPMYLVGAPHAHKSDARRLLETVVGERRRLVTDAEVLQEPALLRRYRTPRRNPTRVRRSAWHRGPGAAC